MKSSPSLASRCARRPSMLAPLLLACACSDPHYVSLGWNDSTERGAPTPGVGVSSDEHAGGARDGDFTRPGDPSSRLACEAGAASIALPAACEARPLGPCPELGALPALTLSALLSSILRECGELDNEIAVEFEQSCALAFELASDSLSPEVAPAPEPPAPDTMATDTLSETAALDAGVREVLAPDAAATARDTEGLDPAAIARAARRRCIADRLSARRFECARDIACGEGSSFPNPTR